MKNRRLISLLIFAFVLTMLGQAYLTMYIPSLPIIARFYGVGHSTIKYSITIFLFGFGISQLFYGPCSDCFGRKKILLIGIIILIIGSILSVFSVYYTEFCISRLVQGIGAGSTMVLMRASLRDFFKGKQLAKVASYLTLGFAVGLGGGPVLGGIIQSYFNWRDNFVFLSIMSFLVLISVFFLYPERKKNEKIIRKKIVKSSLHNYCKIMRNRVFIKFLLGGICIYSISVAYNVMTPFLLQNKFNLTPEQYGNIGLLVAAASFSGAFVNSKYVKKITPEIMILIGILVFLISGIILSLFSIIDYVNVYSVILPILFAIFAQALVWSNAVSGAMSSQSENVGTASALFSGLQLIIVSCLSIVLSIIPDSTQTYFAIMIMVLGFFAIVIFYIKIPFYIFYKH